MGGLLPGLIWGILAPIVVIVGAMWLLRKWRASVVSERQEYHGAMGSPAMEAMMAEARRQREMLNAEGDSDSGDQSRGNT